MASADGPMMHTRARRNTQVFYPGGYDPDPKGWRGRTALAIAGICAAMVPVFAWSSKHEERPLKPKFWIPTMMWYPYFGNGYGPEYEPKVWKVHDDN